MSAAVLSSAQRKQLLEHKDRTITQRAGALFQNVQSTDRMKVYADWKAVLQLKPDSGHGRAVFKQHCSACHRLDQEGVAVGPDLFGMRNQPKDVILLHVIVPEYEILPGFSNYEVEMKDGSTESGMIASETSTSVVLRKALGEERVLARANINSIAASGLSLMPQGLEANMSRQDMADLLAYLKGE
jgi:putative heme-binding domain-containing protein